MNRLILFTQQFPFGKGESFIENEIGFLSIKFNEIIIFPLFYVKGGIRKLPQNCILINPIFRNNKDILIKGIFSFSPIFYFIKHLLTENLNYNPSRLLKYLTTSLLCRGILANRKFKKINQKDYDATYYFYWGIGFAHILPFIKGEKKIIRFHGTDLYLERRKNQYIPFRKEVYSNLTKAVFISKQGLEYAKKTYSNIPFTAILSYLGTNDHGVHSITNDDQIIHILSCSNVIKLKRVDAILKALLLIKDHKISWTHIGDGPELKNLCMQIQNLPDNINVNFAGYLPNFEVIKFYCDHPIDLFINVSTSEGLPVSIMEAISFNIPVLATNVGGTNEIVNNETGILLESDFTTEELATKIIELYEKREEYHPREFWTEHFDAKKNYTDFVNCILE